MAISCFQRPIQHVQTKDFYLLFLKKGTLHMTVKIPFSGYVSGQNIPLTCHFENDSKVKVESVKASLSIVRINYNKMDSITTLLKFRYFRKSNITLNLHIDVNFQKYPEATVEKLVAEKREPMICFCMCHQLRQLLTIVILLTYRIR